MVKPKPRTAKELRLEQAHRVRTGETGPLNIRLIKHADPELTQTVNMYRGNGGHRLLVTRRQRALREADLPAHLADEVIPEKQSYDGFSIEDIIAAHPAISGIYHVARLDPTTGRFSHLIGGEVRIVSRTEFTYTPYDLAAESLEVRCRTLFQELVVTGTPLSMFHIAASDRLYADRYGNNAAERDAAAEERARADRARDREDRTTPVG